MKQRRVWLAILMILVVMAFGFSTSYAEDFTIWQGKWFKLTEKISALQANESGSISPLNYSQTIYIHISEVDETNGVLHCENYDYRNGGLESTGDIDIRVSDGSSIDFSWWTQVGPEVVDVITGQLAGRIKGKIKKGVLTSATVTTVGGAAYATFDDVPTVLGISWKGSLVPESKVPPIK
jgi:hypothetical protein